jgi:AAA15 family ATPase/GTPase
MSQINNIYFENYRIFEGVQKFAMRPINFLIGPNSSGKSSIFKSLLLLKSNTTTELQILDFSNTKHNLGSFANTVNKASESKDITFGFEATINDGTPYSFNKLSFTSKRSIYSVLFEDSEKEVSIKIFLTYSKYDTSGKLRKVEIYKEKDEKPFLRLEVGNPNDEFHKLYFNHTVISKNKILNEIFIRSVIRDRYEIDKTSTNYNYKTSVNLTVNDNKISKYYDEPILVFSNLYDEFLDSNVKLNLNKDVHRFLKGMPLRRILKDFASLIENTEYIEAVRANTKRLYTNDSQGTSFNELILEYRSREISQKAIDFTNKWLRLFGIADGVEFYNVEGVANTVYLLKGSEKVALADLGYGITQFLPIIMRISLEQPIEDKKRVVNILKKTILLEEPETNLHPKLQSLLADFIVDAINTFEVRFVIETHSEYVIRKLQILTAEKKILPESTAIYYFNDPEKKHEEQIIDIDILANGSLSKDFGDGFFDEASELKFQLLTLKNRTNR